MEETKPTMKLQTATRGWALEVVASLCPPPVTIVRVALCWLNSDHLWTMLMGTATTTTAHLASADSTTTPKYWLRRRLTWNLQKKIVGASTSVRTTTTTTTTTTTKQKQQQWQQDTFEDPRSWPEEVWQVQEEASLDNCTSMVQLRLGFILCGALFYARVTFETLVVFNFKVP